MFSKLTRWYFPISLAFIGAVAAAPVVFLLLRGYSLEWSDTIRLYAPLRKEVVEAIRAWHLPLWNTWEGLGMPLFAQMIHGVLHPVSLFTALVAPHSSCNLLIVIDIALAAAGASLLAHNLGASRWGALVSGIAYALSGYVLSMSANLMYLACAATAPWAITSLRKAGERSGSWIALAGITTTIAWFGGDPQWAIIDIMIGGILAVEAAGWRGLLRVGGAVAIGTAMAAIQLVPTWVFLGETMRNLVLAPEERLQWALSPWRLIEFVAPGFFSGRPGTQLVLPVFQALGGDHQWFFIPFSASLYFGIIPLVLGVMGVITGRKGILLATSAIILLWLALGTFAGADQLVRHLPVWGSFRYPEKLIGPFTLCITMLAGLGIDRAADLIKYWKLSAVVTVCTLSLAAFLGVTAGNWLPWGSIGAIAAQSAREHLVAGLIFTACSLALLTTALGLAARKPVFRNRLTVIMATLIFLSSVAAAPYALHFGSPGLTETTMLKRLLPKDDFVRLMHPVDVMEGDGPTMLDKTDRLQVMESGMARASYNVWSHLDAYDVYTGLMPRRFTEIDVGLDYVLGNLRWWAIRRFACSHVLLPIRRPLSTDNTVRAAIKGGMRLETPDLTSLGIEVWEVPHRPWAFFAGTVTSAGTEDDARRLLIESFSSNREDVIVEGIPSGTYAGGRIFSVQRSSGSVTIDAESSGPGLLILNDAWWPGWTASVDRQPVIIRRADALVRAVEWPSGRHVLTMRYDPPEIRYGIMISIAGLLATIALLARTAWPAPRWKISCPD